MGKTIESNILEMNRERKEELLRSYTMRSRQEKIDSSPQKLYRVSDADLTRRRRENRLLRAYCAQALKVVADQAEELPGVYMLFDPEGCLIRIKGTRRYLSWMEKKGIALGTLWDFDRTGANAVSIGLTELQGLSTVGEENYMEPLHDAAIYFSPLYMDSMTGTEKFGGMAVMVPVREADSLFMLTAAGIANAMIIHVAMAFRTSESYDAVDAKGMVLLDINTRNGSVTMTHHNRNFFQILGLPQESYRKTYFKPAQEYFDPKPKNRRLWEIIDETAEVHDEELMVSVRGREVEIILTTKPHRQENLGSRGTLLFITTKKQIRRQISEKTSNSAILSADNIIGDSSVMRSRVQKAKLLARTDSNVMIMGESGTGKDIFAQAIHNMSSRRGKPFIAVNCGALPRDLIESELFGYEGGAFTGARKQGNIGKFELADGGTLFLDEIGELPLDLQATLLRAVEQKQFMRLGGSKLVRADVKIISATNANIMKMIDEKKFRADLYYRLGTMQLFLPPLRERGEDVILLAEYFIGRIAARTGRDDTPVLSDAAKEFLRACPWKGNVRELQNVMDCVVQLYQEPVITREQLEENVDPSYLQMIGEAKLIRRPDAAQSLEVTGADGEKEIVTQISRSTRTQASEEGEKNQEKVQSGEEYKESENDTTLDEKNDTDSSWTDREEAAAAFIGNPAAEKSESMNRKQPMRKPGRKTRVKVTEENLRQALHACGGNRSEAARYLGIGRKTLYRYMEKFEMER